MPGRGCGGTKTLNWRKSLANFLPSIVTGPIIMEGVKKWSGGLAFLSILSILSLLSLLFMGGYPAGALLEKGHVGKGENEVGRTRDVLTRF